VKPDDVPSGPLALDTDVFSFLHMRKDRHGEFAPLVAGHELALPFPVVGELRVLPLKAGSKWGAKRTAELEVAIGRCVVIPVTDTITRQWAALYSRFHSRLQSGGVNDMWIAACCLVHGLPLATGNINDFGTIVAEFPSLRLVHPDLWAIFVSVQGAWQPWQPLTFAHLRSTDRRKSGFSSTTPVERADANGRERCSDSSSWGSLVRAQYRPFVRLRWKPPFPWIGQQSSIEPGPAPRSRLVPDLSSEPAVCTLCSPPCYLRGTRCDYVAIRWVAR
jgi:predicted nucleic acid-binding protein